MLTYLDKGASICTIKTGKIVDINGINTVAGNSILLTQDQSDLDPIGSNVF